MSFVLGVVQLVNYHDVPISFTLSLAPLPLGWQLSDVGSVTVLTSPSRSDENTFELPDKVTPTSSTLADIRTTFIYRTQPSSIHMLRLYATAPATSRVPVLSHS